ncbi:MAG: TVP38/TMEM64 family protein [Candidatus Sericytochromatia bacterium]|nr:TVP38/TMEM64 family protein [Candidatus Sericytochromatia bacterium]
MTGDLIAETDEDSTPLPVPSRPTGWKRALRLLAMVLVVCAAVYGLQHVNISQWANPEHIRTLVARYGVWGPLVYTVVKLVTMVLMLPLVPVAIVAGVLYGFVWGLLLNLVTTVIGAAMSFAIGRRLGRQAIQSRLKGRWQGFDKGFQENGLVYIAAARLTPVMPFGGTSYMAAVSSISWRDFLIGTAVGIVPTQVVYTYIGAAAGDASYTKLIVALTLLAIITLIPVIRRQMHKRSQPPQSPAP